MSTTPKASRRKISALMGKSRGLLGFRCEHINKYGGKASTPAGMPCAERTVRGHSDGEESRGACMLCHPTVGSLRTCSRCRKLRPETGRQHGTTRSSHFAHTQSDRGIPTLGEGGGRAHGQGDRARHSGERGVAAHHARVATHGVHILVQWYVEGGKVAKGEVVRDISGDYQACVGPEQCAAV